MIVRPIQETESINGLQEHGFHAKRDRCCGHQETITKADSDLAKKIHGFAVPPMCDPNPFRDELSRGGRIILRDIRAGAVTASFSNLSFRH